jgi:hypothetical protein
LIGERPSTLQAQPKLDSASSLPPPQWADDNPECMAQAEFVLVERQLEAFHQMKQKAHKLKGQPEQIFAEKALELKRQYERIIDYGFDRLEVTALCRMGKIYDIFAENMKNGISQTRLPSTVRRKGKEAIAQYLQQREQAENERIKPLKSHAKKLYQQCLQKGKNLGITNQYTAEAGLRLQQLSSPN